VTDHERLWQRLATALRPAGILEVQCGGAGNIARVREVIQTVARDTAPELVGWSPWEFASAEDTERRLRQADFGSIRCWLQDRPTHPHDVGPFVRTSILAAHLARLPEGRREVFAADVVARVRLPLDYVRLNVSATGTRPGIEKPPAESRAKPRKRVSGRVAAIDPQSLAARLAAS
jgi:trans-aconitate 2-methyltransferase